MKRRTFVFQQTSRCGELQIICSLSRCQLPPIESSPCQTAELLIVLKPINGRAISRKINRRMMLLDIKENKYFAPVDLDYEQLQHLAIEIDQRVLVHKGQYKMKIPLRVLEPTNQSIYSPFLFQPEKALKLRILRPLRD